MDQAILAMIIGSLVLAGSSIIAVIKFWMDRGKAEERAAAAAGKAEETAEHAATQVSILQGQISLLAGNVNDFKVQVAQTYATTKALSEAEQSLARSLDNSVQGIYQRLDNVTTRLDSLITIANRSDHH